MARSDYESVDDYIAAQPAAARPVLERVRATLRKALPGATEGISYRIPVYRLDGRMVLYFAGFQRHYSIYPASARLRATLGKELAGLVHNKATIRFPLDKAVPTRLIARIAKLRAAEAARIGIAKKSAARRGAARAAARPSKPALLAGGNPQIAKANGNAPVQAYIAAMPGWKRDVGRRLDALIVRNVPCVRKSVRWNSPFYGIDGQGWFLGFHVFTRYVKVTFFRGTSLRPVPPGGTGKEARWIDIHEDDLDEAQMASWTKQAAAIPGWGNS